jgi:hypothetical protein
MARENPQQVEASPLRPAGYDSEVTQSYASTTIPAYSHDGSHTLGTERQLVVRHHDGIAAHVVEQARERRTGRVGVTSMGRTYRTDDGRTVTHRAVLPHVAWEGGRRTHIQGREVFIDHSTNERSFRRSGDVWRDARGNTRNDPSLPNALPVITQHPRPGSEL